MKKHYLTLLLTILLAMTASAQTSTESKSLAEIISSGKAGDFYTITDELVGVYVPPRLKNVVFAKDNNNHASKSEPTQAQITAKKVYDDVDEFDQSNWIKILFPTGYDASAYEGKKITNKYKSKICRISKTVFLIPVTESSFRSLPAPISRTLLATAFCSFVCA